MRYREYIKKMLVTYLVILIPVIIISFLIQFYLRKNTESQQKEQLSNRMEYTSKQLDDLTVTALKSSEFFSSMRKLSPYSILGTIDEQRQGVEQIRQLVMLNSSFYDIVFDYETDFVFSGKQMTKKTTYFTQTLSCDSTSVECALDTLRNPQNTMVVLRTNNNNGYILLHYPIQYKTSYERAYSINFIVSYQQIADRVRDLADQSLKYVVLSLHSSESSICFHYMDNKFVAQTELPTLDEIQRKYTIFDEKADLAQISIQAYYNDDLLYGDVRNGSVAYYVLILTCILLSAMVFFIISYYKYRQISLFDVILDQEDQQESFTNGETLLDKIQKKSILITESLFRTRKRIKKEPTELDFLQSCRQQAKDGPHFIGAILFPQNQVLRNVMKLEKLMANEINYRTELNDSIVLYFYSELFSEDSSMEARFDFANKINQLLKVVNTEGVHIGFSSVCHSPSDIGLAYFEAAKTLEFFESNRKPSKLSLCWEEIHKHVEESSTAIYAQIQLLEKLATIGNLTNAKIILHHIIEQLNSFTDSNEVLQMKVLILWAIAVSIKEQNDLKLYMELATVQMNDNSFEDTVKFILDKRVTTTPLSGTYKKIMKYLDENYLDGSLTADFIAETAGITPQYLTKLIKAHTGLSYIEYITILRMEKSCDLLRSTNTAVKDIVLQVGYQDVSSFRKKFKTFYGMSPNEYRKYVQDNMQSTLSELQ